MAASGAGAAAPAALESFLWITNTRRTKRHWKEKRTRYVHVVVIVGNKGTRFVYVDVGHYTFFYKDNEAQIWQ